MFSHAAKLSRSSQTGVTARNPVVQKRGKLSVNLEGGRSSVSGVIATVFGCTGFLGRYVVNHLGRHGSQVVLPFRGEESDYNHLKVMADLGQLVPLKWDSRDKDSIRRASEYSNVIINLVGSRWDTRNFTMKQAHVDSARNIAEVAKEMGVERLIHVSALGADKCPSDWGKSKWESEQVVRSIFPRATIIRPATLWGAQDKFLNQHGQMMRYWPIYPLVHAKKNIQPVFVDDVAKAILNTLKTEEAVGTTYELAGPAVMTKEELADWLIHILKLQGQQHKVPIGEDLLWHLGYWLGQQREPKFTLDWNKQSTDVVSSGKFPGLIDLGVKPTPVNSELALSMLSIYRQPVRFQDVTLDLEEIPDLGRAQEDKPYY
eukprot:TRINITY_DN14667_c0_g1_i1.p1 TRINITY_DN14667_c0_g1~~TRINITY_DN14667_c0_g1_i1.p1  ORF type:complete len:374 (-),score=92.57 TRINITY_DN14667_c0_g1_i1:83-1204(-)